MSSSPDVKGFDSKAKEAEYQALWQTCDRAMRKGDFIYADKETKRNILHTACRARLERRRAQGKTMCGTSITSMVDLHIQREITSSHLHGGRRVPNPASNPAPNPAPFLAQPQNYDVNSLPVNPASNPYLAFPQHQHLPQVPMAPPGLDMRTQNNIIRDLQANLNTQISLEARMQAEEQARAAAAFVQPALPIHHVAQYPLQGLNGGGFDISLPIPMTPGSQTQCGDEDDQKGVAPSVEA
ncbi:hypothetical protein FLONG3_3280 [Fusarium longipes]|uniref:Uncharacterized protein n=1 Tax=Fusarium longipes TaxID=694270 RepID=A0A395T1K6_9HYPO|nr:hypothetical protein FLONG3_3280 [Fusarium longipes]